MSDKVKIYGYGLAIKWALTLPYAIDQTATDKALKEAKGFMGYDDKDGFRFYFFITPELRDKARLDEINAGEYGLLIDEVAELSDPVRFVYDNAWLERSAEEIRN